MISKTILVGLVAIAFVAGSIMTGTVVYGAKPPAITLNDVYAVVTNIQTKVTTLLTNVATLQTTSNDIKVKTDSLPSDPASQTSVNALNAKLDVIKCNSPIRENVDWSGCTLRFFELTGADLSGSNFAGTDFLGSVFSNANLNNSNLSNANMQGAHLDGTHLDGAILDGADFTSCTGTPIGIPYAGPLPTCS